MNTNQKAIRTYAIADGPSADRLFDACKYAYDTKAKVPIRFSIVLGYTMPKYHPNCATICAHSCELLLKSIEHEDGSGNTFNIGGYCKGFKEGPLDSPKYVNCGIKIYYDSKTRTGTITFFYG